MKKRLLFLFIFSLLFSVVFCQNEHYNVNPRFSYGPTPEEQQMLLEWYKQTRTTTPPAAPVTALAEFHPMGGVMIAYRLGIPVSLVRELSMITSVKVLVYPATDSNTAKSYFQSNGVNMNNIEYWVINHDSHWTRDYGPWFIIDGNDEVGVVDFTYNRPQRPNDDAVLQKVAEKMRLNRYEMNMVHTGGNYMVDGYGTAASTSLILEENPNQTVATLTNLAHDFLGIDNYLITNDPLGDYIAHIDCWGKFLAPDKVLIAQVPTSDSRYTEYEIAANIFSNATTAWGNHYQVYRVFEPGNNSVTPYTNSLIINDHVFVPITGKSWDDAAIAVYEQAMPGYTIVPIIQSNITPWYNTDALHCRTHELADTGMLFIRHSPVMGTQISNPPIRISAEIKPLSGQPLMYDSVLTYYRVNHGGWQNVVMSSVGGSIYEAELSNLTEGGEVEYYVFAKDQSGRRACHPYIGAADPHHFYMENTGIEHFENKEIKMEIFPNPATDKMVVRGENPKKISVYDPYGRSVWSQNAQEEAVVIPCAEWATGIYTVVVKTAAGQVQKKIVKTN